MLSDTCSVVRFSNPSLTLFRYCTIFPDAGGGSLALGPERVWLRRGLIPVEVLQSIASSESGVCSSDSVLLHGGGGYEL